MPSKESNRQKLHRCLCNSNGAEIIRLLDEEFGGSCYEKGDPYHTAYLEGRRDAVTYMKEVKDAGTIIRTVRTRRRSAVPDPATVDPAAGLGTAVSS
jgi:hypothetical protein